MRKAARSRSQVLTLLALGTLISTPVIAQSQLTPTPAGLQAASMGDVLLGGIDFRGSSDKETLVEPIYASQLFARMGSMPPKMFESLPDAERGAYLAQASSKLSQDFVIALVARILDLEAARYKVSLAVPDAWVERATDQILAKAELPAASREARFRALRAKTGEEPFQFAVQVEEGFQPFPLMGQAPPFAPDKFPETLAALKSYLREKLIPLRRFAVRKSVADGLVLKQAPDFQHPLSSHQMISVQEMERVYAEEKDELAVSAYRQDFEVLQLMMKVSKSCRPVLRTAFEEALMAREKIVAGEIQKMIAGCKITPEEAEKLFVDQRMKLTESALTAARPKIFECDPQAVIKPLSTETIVFDSAAAATPVTAFAASRIEARKKRKAGPFHHERLASDEESVRYLFLLEEKPARREYVSLSTKEMSGAIRGLILMRRKNRVLEGAFRHLLDTRYVVRANTRPFTYGGIEGYKLRDAVLHPKNSGKGRLNPGEGTPPPQACGPLAPKREDTGWLGELFSEKIARARGGNGGTGLPFEQVYDVP